MNHSNLLRRLVGGFILFAVVAITTLSGCTQYENTLGSDLTLENQAIKLGQMDFSGLSPKGNDYFEARLYRTDSINTGSITYGYIGTMGNDTFGMRQAGFYSQYLCVNSIDEDVFGFMPIYDSMMLYMEIGTYGGDTNLVQKFEVFEVIDNTFVTESADSIFFPDFDMTPFLASDPVFTFTFPDQDNDVYTNSTQLRMYDTDATQEFVDRLMFNTIDGDYDYEIHEDDEEWVEQFKGLYIRPVEPLTPASGTSGAIYGITLNGSGFGFFGRSREETDPTLIVDTIGMTYTFYSDYAEAGNISLNTIAHNYDGSLIDESQVQTPFTTGQVETTSVLRVEAMAGVVSQITISEEFFEQLDTIFTTEEAETGELYTSLFFNQAMLRIYMQEVDGYDSNAIDPYVVTDWMDYMPTNLGLYTNYSNYYLEYEDYEDVYYLTLTGVADYVYYYESSYTLDFGGALNRSWGCYVMNIANYVQGVWNEYLEAKEEAVQAGTEINWDDVPSRVIYLGPTATDLFGQKYASLQAGDNTLNSAPMTLELTYTMIR